MSQGTFLPDMELLAERGREVTGGILVVTGERAGCVDVLLTSNAESGMLLSR